MPPLFVLNVPELKVRVFVFRFNIPSMSKSMTGENVMLFAKVTFPEVPILMLCPVYVPVPVRVVVESK